MTDVGRVTAMIQCAGDAQELLRGALVAVQEAELSEKSSVLRDDLDSVTAALAGVAGTLSCIRSGRVKNQSGIQAELDQVHRTLERTLDTLASDHLVGSDVAGCREDVARALALVFASGGGPRTSVPPSGRITSAGQPLVSSRASAPPTQSPPTIEVGEIDADSLGLDDLESLTPSERPFIHPEGQHGPAKAGVPRESLAPPSGERRSMERMILEVEVGLVSESNFYAGLTMDLSTGGLFVATYAPRPVGTSVLLSFVLPDGYVITTPGQVRWLREPRGDAAPGIGVAFAELEPEDLEAIERFCQQRDPLYHDSG